ncbi:rep helicasE [Caudoviricetes sp.]|nr:rep helicasE [Caudoviricetes sp.]
MHPETEIVFGPPGTGKTTKLLSIVDSYLQHGLPADQICYVGFTRRSANEARERAMIKFNLQEDQLPWFRTLHSTAFGMMMLGKNDIMTVGDWIAIAKQLGLSITVGAYSNDEGVFAGQTKGDRLLFAESMARSRMMELKEYWNTIPDEDIYYYELLQVRETIETYKKHHNKVDYTDIIYQFSHSQCYLAPPASVLIVDEAQDLSPLQWRMVDKLSNTIGKTYIAGDDDQAIFRWAGADVDKLIDLPGQRLILTQSYRVPEEIQRVADEIAQRISVRVEKHWKPREAKGSVTYQTSIEHIDMSTGDWLLLARNAYLLEYYANECLRQGYIFDMKGNSLIDAKIVPAIEAWNRLSSGNDVVASKVKTMWEFMASGTRITRGYKGKFDDVPNNKMVSLSDLKVNYGLRLNGSETWDYALDRISDREREYFLAAQRKGEQFTDKPRIRISTIHGAKGAEATNVVVMTDMALRTYVEMEKTMDDEHRVWYVAVSRARENLHIIQPMTDKFYQI